ncbi:hypothetical protein GOP47_0030622 [Adiantum capillus-veneris]|nr:hypothetical protein GOP47_0030622 [Adiantum capillus-veneris]
MISHSRGRLTPQGKHTGPSRVQRKCKPPSKPNNQGLADTSQWKILHQDPGSKLGKDIMRLFQRQNSAKCSRLRSTGRNRQNMVARGQSSRATRKLCQVQQSFIKDILKAGMQDATPA